MTISRGPLISEASLPRHPVTSAGMFRRAPTLLLVAALSLYVPAIFGLSTADALTFAPCASSPAFSCTTVPVPLDRSAQLPGTISLSVERKQAGPLQGKAAVLALAGGPGQAALPLGEFIAKAIAPALGARDLLLFDQRGTGASDPLSCSALSSFSGASASQAFEHCALEIGPARGAYTTQESVQTSRRSARPRAMKSSSCTAPPTARRSPSSTPNATRNTSKRSCSTRSCRRTGPNRSRSPPSRRSDRCSASCARNTPARGSRQTPWRTSRA